MKTVTQYLALATSTIIISACATSLAERTPFEIALDSMRRVDTLTGHAEILGPRVKPILNKNTYIDANANLRTAGEFTSRDGRIKRDGAYLDLVINYTTATPDPKEARLYDEVSFSGGYAGELAHFGDTIVDCRQEVREVNHFGYYGYYPYYRHYGGYWGKGYDGWGRWDPRRRRSGGHRDRSDRPDIDDADPDTRPRPRRRSVPGDVDEPVRRRPPVASSQSLKPKTMQPVALEPYSVNRPNPVRRPVSGSSTTTKPKVSKPVVSRPKVSKPKKASKPKFVPKPQARTKQVERTFSETRNVRTRSSSKWRPDLRYYPMNRYYGVDYDVRYRCERQESLRVFIPRERLDFAEDHGLFIYVTPQAGHEETVVLPANYVRGFKLAAYAPDGDTFAQQAPPKPYYPAQYGKTGQVPTQASPSTKKHVEPSANTPIIYGDIK